jgi:hypothetical protein
VATMGEVYDNATKDSWRGWAWNQLETRLGKSYAYAPKKVCVLAGDIAGDLPHAVKRNIDCVAVDTSQNCVRRFRENGGVATNDGLHNQIIALQPDGIIADLVSGVTVNSCRMMIDATGVCDAVIFNLLRGRDKGMGEADLMMPSFYGREKRLEYVGKHRGRLLLLFAGAVISEMWLGTEKGSRFVPDELFNYMKPSFYSYRSVDSGQYFDSVAVTTKDFRLGGGKAEMDRLRTYAPVDSRRKAAAAKALLTSRRQRN